jgi:hypothetical protein
MKAKETGYYLEILKVPPSTQSSEHITLLEHTSFLSGRTHPLELPDCGKKAFPVLSKL